MSGTEEGSMRKAARSHIALGLVLVLLTACQSADRSPVGPTAAQPAQEQGTVRAAAVPVPVPGGPGSIPVPGSPGGNTPVPGKPSKNPPPGSQPTPSPSAAPTPTPGPTPTPAPASLSFTATGVPVVATPSGTGMRITSIIPVSGITGPVLNITVALRATIPDNSEVRDIRVLKNYRFSQTAASPLYSDTIAPSQLSGADLGTSCTPFGGATTFDERAGIIRIWGGSAPYAGVFRSEASGSPLSAMANALRDPLDSNGDWQLDMFLEPGAVATLECWRLIIQYQP
jgi:hypothetical protein